MTTRRYPTRLSLALLALLTVLAVLASAPDANAAPGNPGVPGPPLTVFTEDFENVTDPTKGQFLDTYTGAAPLSMTYTADPSWISATLCNGTIASYNSTDPNGTCSNHVFNAYIRPLARGLGGGAGVGEDNQAMGDVTAGSGSVADPAATLQTVGQIPLPATGRFITFSVKTGVVSCSSPHDPLLKWYLLDGANTIPATTNAVNPCTDPRGSAVGTVRVGTYPSDSSILVSSNQIGLKLTNAQTGGSGNDYAVDDVTALDATPQLDKDFEPSTSSGVPATLTFTITNTTDLAKKEGWSFTDTLPLGLTVATPTGATTNCANGAINATAGGTAIDVSGDLNAGQASCTATVEVVSPVPGSFQNCAADLSDVVGLDPPACSTLNVGPASDLELTKSAAPASPNPGAPLTYTLEVSNNGPDPSPGATVTDTLPTGVNYMSDTGGCTYTPATRELSCPNIGALGVGDPPATITVNTTVDVTAGSTVQTNGAEVTGQNFDPEPDNDTDSVDVPVPPIADLSVTKSAAPNPVNDGDNVTYTLQVANAGPTDSDVVLTDTLPAQLTFVDPPTSDLRCGAVGQVVTCNLGTLTGGGPGTTVTIVATVAAGATGSRTNAAQVASTDNPATPGTDPVPESSPGNNEDDVTVQIAPPESDLRLAKTVPPGPFHPGDQMPYTLTVTNDGPDDSPATTVTDTLPAGLSYVSDDAGCTVNGRDVSCNLGTLANGASETVTVIARLDAVTGPSVTNSAGVSGTNDDPDPGDNAAAVPAATKAPDTDDTLCFFGNKVTILGTNKPETIVGTPGRDVINGRRGDDVILGLDGDDLICGGRGDDLIKGGDGDDRVKGSLGDDRIRGNLGDDWLRGAPGDDVINGRAGNDRLMGNRGDDRLRGRRGNDTLLGGPGRDWGHGGPGRDKAFSLVTALSVGRCVNC